MGMHDDVFAGWGRSSELSNGEAKAPLSGESRRRSKPVAPGPMARAFREDFTSILALYILPTIMRLVVLRGMLSAARELAVRSDLVRAMSEALESEQRTYHLESAWALQKGPGSKRDARPLDAELDRSLSALARLLASTAETLDRSHPRSEAARRLQGLLFPNGVKAITQQSHQAQSAAVAVLLTRASKLEVMKDLVTLGLEDQMARLSRLHEDFDRALREGEALEFSEIKRRRDGGRRALRTLVLRILGTYYGDDEPSREIREALMAPVFAQSEKRRRAYRQRTRSPR